MPAGRPTSYTPELLEKAKEYLKELPKDEAVHSVAGLCDYIDISRETAYAWAKEEDKAIFSDILKEVMRKQEKTLANKGLKGQFNPTITKLMLTKHGYSDKQELTGKDGEALKITFDPVFNTHAPSPQTENDRSIPGEI